MTKAIVCLPIILSIFYATGSLAQNCVDLNGIWMDRWKAKTEIKQEGCEEYNFYGVLKDGKRTEAFPLPLREGEASVAEIEDAFLEGADAKLGPKFIALTEIVFHSNAQKNEDQYDVIHINVTTNVTPDLPFIDLTTPVKANFYVTAYPTEIDYTLTFEFIESDPSNFKSFFFSKGASFMMRALNYHISETLRKVE